MVNVHYMGKGLWAPNHHSHMGKKMENHPMFATTVFNVY